MPLILKIRTHVIDSDSGSTMLEPLLEIEKMVAYDLKSVMGYLTRAENFRMVDIRINA